MTYLGTLITLNGGVISSSVGCSCHQATVLPVHSYDEVWEFSYFPTLFSIISKSKNHLFYDIGSPIIDSHRWDGTGKGY